MKTSWLHNWWNSPRLATYWKDLFPCQACISGSCYNVMSQSSGDAAQLHKSVAWRPNVVGVQLQGMVSRSTQYGIRPVIRDMQTVREVWSRKWIACCEERKRRTSANTWQPQLSAKPLEMHTGSPFHRSHTGSLSKLFRCLLRGPRNNRWNIWPTDMYGVHIHYWIIFFGTTSSLSPIPYCYR